MQGLLAIPSAEGEGGVYWTVETNELTGKGFRWSLRQTEGGGGGSQKRPHKAQELGKEQRERPSAEQVGGSSVNGRSTSSGEKWLDLGFT